MATGLGLRVALEGFGFGMGFHANLKHEGARVFPFAVKRSVALKTQLVLSNQQSVIRNQ